MPIHEFKCKKCGKIIEMIIPINDNTNKYCPYCGEQMERLISLSNFKLIGDGWYQTDYTEKNDKNEKKDENV